eukprot:scaffold280999_cov27-Tisochrysis_lutea.AAC.1
MAFNLCRRCCPWLEGDRWRRESGRPSNNYHGDWTLHLDCTRRMPLSSAHELICSANRMSGILVPLALLH